MHQLLTDREYSLKMALEHQREKNLVQMETKLKELNWKVASWSETLCRVRAGLECKDHISFLRVRRTRPYLESFWGEGERLIDNIFTYDFFSCLWVV